MRRSILFSVLFSFTLAACFAQETNSFLHFNPPAEKANGKKIVLVSGDEEYRSEESLPMLAQILTNNGFESTVLFAINPTTGKVDPEYVGNIPGLEQLETADLLIIATRFRELPDEQMRYIDAYLMAGKPVIGMRTATHAFNFEKDSKSAYTRYGYNSQQEGWKGGFGKLVLGETWISHHGEHGSEGTRGLIDGVLKNANHPILKGVEDIWGPTDVYTVHAPAAGTTVLMWGQSSSGMEPASPLNWAKPIMPVAWTKPYQLPAGKQGKAFATTMGAATDLTSEDLRRMIVNACYWALDLEQAEGVHANVEIIGRYQPTMFGFGGFQKDKSPEDFIQVGIEE